LRRRWRCIYTAQAKRLTYAKFFAIKVMGLFAAEETGAIRDTSEPGEFAGSVVERIGFEPEVAD
jgi:hypothetical protein